MPFNPAKNLDFFVVFAIICVSQSKVVVRAKETNEYSVSMNISDEYELVEIGKKYVRAC